MNDGTPTQWTAPPRSNGRALGGEVVLESLAEVVFRTDPAGNWTYLNRAWTAITGFPVADTLGTNFLDYVHPEEREHTVALFMAVVAGGGRYCHHQTRYRTADGGYRWIDLRATLLEDDDGRLIGNAGTLIDITDTRASQETVTEHAHLLEIVADGGGMDELPIGVATYGSDLTLIRVSPVLERMLGIPMRVGDNLTSLLVRVEANAQHGGRLTGEWGMIATALRTGRPQHSDLHLIRPDRGSEMSLRASVLPLTGDSPADFALVLHDVTSLRQAERQQAGLARLGQRSLAGETVPVLLQAAVAVVADILDTPLCEILELSSDQNVLLPRASVGWQGEVGDMRPVPADSIHSALAPALTADGPVMVTDLTRGTLVAEPWLSTMGAISSLAVVIAGPNEPFGVLAAQTLEQRRFTAVEISFVEGVANVIAAAVERARGEEATLQQTLHDPLTGLANRALLLDHLSLALHSARRHGHRVALLLLDLDRFKDINDTLGHDAGDEALRLIATRLRTATRQSDTVARLGGDEFALVLPAVGDAADAVALAAKLTGLIEKQFELHGAALQVQGSIGIAMSPQDGTDPLQLLKHADVAMYRAKSLRTGVAVYSATDGQNRPRQLAYHSELQRGIAHDELVVHYQPKIDLATGATVGAEALVRWQHPTDGLLPPQRFLPLAEETGLIKPLTWHVIDSALTQARHWREAAHDLPVAVNLSARMIHNPDLLRYIVTSLQRHAVPPASLTVEITESAMMANPSSGMEVVSRLRAEGVKVSLDDFGTGHCSLAYLRDLPVNELKIDGSFIRDITTSSKTASIIRAIIDLAHTLSLRVVAEGIENADTYELLKSFDCDEGQGFYIGRPGPAENLNVPAA